MDWTTMRFSAAWAAKRQERLKASLGEESYRDLEAAVLWGLGARARDLQAMRGLGRSSLYEHLMRLLASPPDLAAAPDGDSPGPVAPPLEPALAARIVELLVEQGLDPEAISRRLAEQDGTQLSPEEVRAYLQRASLADYASSPFRQQALPLDVPGLTASLSCGQAQGTGSPTSPGTFTRYAAHLLQIPALNALGLARVMPLLDVTQPTTYYSHWLRCYTLLLSLSAGKQRLYHTGELVADEFAALLGSERYPQRSDPCAWPQDRLHAYLDRIVERDQAEVEAGVPEAERTVARFVQESQTVLAQAAGPGAGKEIYLDTHTIALHTEKPVAETKHGIWNRVVKALVKIRTVSATLLGRALTFTLEQGDVSPVSQVEAAIERVEWATGEQVEMVGMDRGALSQEVLEACEDSDTGLAVWADDTAVLRRAVAAVPRDAFVDGEYETIRRSDGQKVRRLKTRLADVAEMVINRHGYHCRTVVVVEDARQSEDVRNGHRAAFHAVGRPAERRSARELLAFLRGKQWAEEDFKQGRAWGSDAFCGGEIRPALRREQPTETEVAELMGQAHKLKRRWRENLAEEGAAVAQWRTGKLRKRQLNDLLKGIRRRRKQIEADWEATEELIRWGRTAIVPPSQVRWVVDTRKMTILAQFQDFIRQARRDTLTQVGRCMEQLLVEGAIAERGGGVEERERRFIEREVQEAVQCMPWGQMGIRFFDQGGWVRKDPETRVMHVTLKSFGPRLVQQACERLCEHLNSLSPVMHCEDGNYTLHYACQPKPPG